MRRRRARLVAVAVVLVAAMVSAAHGAFTVTLDPAASAPAPHGAPVRILVSLRNQSSSSVMVGSAGRSGSSGNMFCPTHVTIARAGGGVYPFSVPGYKQEQFLISTPGFTTTDTMGGMITPQCVWEVSTMDGPVIFSTTFMVDDTAPATWDVQPNRNDFGSQSTTDFEVQRVYINNLTSSAITYAGLEIVGDLTQGITFASECPNLQTCPGGTIPANSYKEILIECDPITSGAINAQLKVIGMGGMFVTPDIVPNEVASTDLFCNAFGAPTGPNINIVPATIDLAGPQGMPQSYPAMIDSTTPDTMVSAQITGVDAAAFSIMECGGLTSCTFMPPVGLPSGLTIECTPDGGTQTAVLEVYGGGGGMDFDMAPLSCSTTSGGPVIMVMPPMIDAGSTPVGVEVGPFPLHISNTGDDDLIHSIFLSDPAWRVGACESPQSCTIPPSGNAIIDVYFNPMVPGPANATLTVDSNAGMPTVSLFGSGDGSRLDVVDPMEPFEIDFGTIARNQLASRTVHLATTGTQGVMVTLGSPGAPYMLSTTSVSLPPNGTGTFAVTCQSSTPIAASTDTISISSTAFEQNTTAISVACTVVDTDVQVTPTTFDFEELRVGMPTKTIGFTISNPGPPVALQYVRLSATRPGLGLSSIPGQTLATGAMIFGELTLESDQEVDLAGVFLQVGADGKQLQFPVLGKVVTPSAYVTPVELDLGTACLGSQVSGTITMVNDGTATLRVEHPQMDQSSFAVTAMAPSSYPADLRAGDQATVRVAPSTSSNGMVASELTWSVDAPASPFRVPVRLSYVDGGTALSPNRLGFGIVEVTEVSPQQTITLENCSTANAFITVRGVIGVSGPVSAWNVSPRATEATLGPNDKLMIFVRFEPKEPGSYRARINVEVEGELRTIEVEGFAPGDVRDPTSFYACSCSGHDAPSRGWPIVLAIVLILRPRRRR